MGYNFFLRKFASIVHIKKVFRVFFLFALFLVKTSVCTQFSVLISVVNSTFIHLLNFIFWLYSFRSAK